MRTLNVDLRSRWVPPRWAWGGVALLFAIALALGFAAYRESQTLEALKARRAELLRQLAEPVKSQPAPAQRMPYDASAREMLALATSQWPEMLTALESVEIIGVTPTALEISPAERWIRVEVEFSDYAKLLEYINGLNAGEPQSKWSLVQAQSSSPSAAGQDPSKSVASLRGGW